MRYFLCRNLNCIWSVNQKLAESLTCHFNSWIFFTVMHIIKGTISYFVLLSENIFFILSFLFLWDRWLNHCLKCDFHSQDETTLIWYSRGKERNLKLASISRIIPGQRTVSSTMSKVA